MAVESSPKAHMKPKFWPVESRAFPFLVGLTEADVYALIRGEVSPQTQNAAIGMMIGIHSSVADNLECNRQRRSDR